MYQQNQLFPGAGYGWILGMCFAHHWPSSIHSQGGVGVLSQQHTGTAQEGAEILRWGRPVDPYCGFEQQTRWYTWENMDDGNDQKKEPGMVNHQKEQPTFGGAFAGVMIARKWQV